MMIKSIGEVFSKILGKTLIDPERKFEKDLWLVIQGQSYDFSTNYKKIHFDKLDSEEQRQKVKVTILRMLESENYSVSKKTLLAYVCADLKIQEAIHLIDKFRKETNDSLKYAFTLCFEALARGVTVPELGKAVYEQAVAECKDSNQSAAHSR